MQEPTKTVLRNGLTLILLESHAAPVVSMNLCCKVGSRYEGRGESGMCHLIEHMIFKGTPTYPVGEIARKVEASGGDINAYTSFDETVFYINMASRYQDEGLKILADAALNPLFDDDELTREKEVVVEEISRSEDSPAHQVSEDLFKTAFQHHNYGNPIAGTRESVRETTRQQLFDFYKQWYVGPNLIFVIAGDFNTKTLLPKLKRLFSPFSAKAAPKMRGKTEPVQRKPRAVTRPMNISGRYLGMGFHTPALVDPDIQALDLLAHILAGGESSRLDQQIREELGLVRMIESACYTPEEPCLFLIDAELAKDKPQPVIKSILKEVYRLHNEPVSPAELARAKINLRSAQVYERETVEGLSRKLGFFEIVAGDYRYEDKYYKGIETVTPAKIQDVARRYLIPDNMTVALCQPAKSRKKVTKQQLISGLPRPPKSSARRGTRKKQDIQVFKLPGGIKVLIKENPQVPLIAIRTASLGGIRLETPRNNGISHLISEVLTKGTEHRSSLEIANHIEGMAGALAGYAGRNLIGLKGSFLAEKLEEGMSLFTDVLCNSSFDTDEVKREIKHTLSALRDEEDLPVRLAMKGFIRKLFPQHPYRMTIMGTKQAVRSLTSQQLLRTYRKWIRPDNLVLSVVGDVQAEEVREILAEKLENLDGNKVKLPRPKRQQEPAKAQRIVTKRRGLNQAHLIIGFLGSTLKSPDRYGLDVLNAVLAGQGGRLFLELRDRQSLAYTVNAHLYEGIETGYISVYMGTDPEKLDVALAGIEAELTRLVREPITRKELSRAKRYLIGTHALDLQRNSTVGALMAYDEIYGLGFDDYLSYETEVDKVTIDQVQALAKKYLRLNHSVTSIVTP